MANFWQLFCNFLTTFWQFFGNFLTTFCNYMSIFLQLFGNFLVTCLLLIFAALGHLSNDVLKKILEIPIKKNQKFSLTFLATFWQLSYKLLLIFDTFVTTFHTSLSAFETFLTTFDTFLSPSYTSHLNCVNSLNLF